MQFSRLLELAANSDLVQLFSEPLSQASLDAAPNIVLAQPSESEDKLRARLIELDQDRFRVEFVDVGLVDTVAIDKVFVAPEQLLQEPPLVKVGFVIKILRQIVKRQLVCCL